MQIPQTGNTQTERFTEELLRLSADVTAKDRAAAADKLVVTKQTISRYLNGDVRDNDTAVSLIAFFKQCIADRDKIIA